MTKNIFFLLFFMVSNLIYSQQKNLFEAGINIVGAELSYERNLSNKFSIKSSLGYNGSIYRTSGATFNDKKNVYKPIRQKNRRIPNGKIRLIHL